MPFNLEIIVREHCDKMTEDEIIKDCSSTIGYKLTHNSIQYGEYVIFAKPTLTVDEVVEATNELLSKAMHTLLTKSIFREEV